MWLKKDNDLNFMAQVLSNKQIQIICQMKIRMFLLSVMAICAFSSALAAGEMEETDRYIEVTGISETEIIPDEIHFVIEMKEFWIEEFEGKEPKDFKNKVSMSEIEARLRSQLSELGIADNAVRVEEIGNYMRGEGRQFGVSKRFDITLSDFGLIDKISNVVDKRAVVYMRIGELKNSKMGEYRKEGKIAALKAAHDKASYMAETLGVKIGKVLQIIEPCDGMGLELLGSRMANVVSNDADGYDNFRTIRLQCKMKVRFAIE